MSEPKYKSSEIFVIIGVVVVAVAVVTTPLSCTMNDNATMEAMVKAGANPMDAQCAVKSGISKELCAIRAATKSEVK